jgi:hypothetical protein
VAANRLKRLRLDKYKQPSVRGPVSALDGGAELRLQ